MNDKGNRYALAALRHKRGIISTEIIELQSKLRHRRDMLVHVDASLKLLDPSIKVDAIPNRRPPKRIRLFRQGELGRMIVDALRRAGKPLATAEIVASVVAAGGHGEGATTAMAPRVRGNLQYLDRRGKVSKTSTGRTARWTLAG